MGLASGKYLTKVERTVVVWPPADADGDGKEVWIDQKDSDGRNVGRTRAKDSNGKEIFEYSPPDGFVNRPSFDHTDNYVLVTDRGEIVRQPNGEAICIKPGQALVVNPDGSVETLTDEYTQYMFSEAHDFVEDPSEKKASKKAAKES